MAKDIGQRLHDLRRWLQREHLYALIIPGTDPHRSEYTPSHWQLREWMTGFTGSAGNVVVTRGGAALWTDSRYFIQAAEQLEGTGVDLVKDRLPDTPDFSTWIRRDADMAISAMHADVPLQVGVDARLVSHAEAEELSHALSGNKLALRMVEVPFDELWPDRPPLPKDPIVIHPLQYAGQPVASKIEQVREFLHRHTLQGIWISALDEIAWLLNLRGSDVPCNPVFVSYLYITEESAVLYVDLEKLTVNVRQYLADNGIGIADYDMAFDNPVQCDGQVFLPDSLNEALWQKVSVHARVQTGNSPIAMWKARKNEVEQNGFRAAMLRDGAAMVRFMMWVKGQVGKTPITEIDIEQKLFALRSRQPLFRGVSFATIAGYGPHAAIVHYEADETSNVQLQAKGFVLVDSGAQYADGTTDITRTLALGPLTDEEKQDYTLVLKGMIGLSRVHFPTGTTGTQLDLAARLPMWKHGVNFTHGTGHGVGSYLNVHEGPHQIRMNYVPAPLCAGMTVTNEPGIYKEGRHGVRIENVLLVQEAEQTEFGTFLRFETLTLCPIDLDGVDVTMLTDDEKAWLNAYHRRVYNALQSQLNEAERDWLKQATRPIE